MTFVPTAMGGHCRHPLRHLAGTPSTSDKLVGFLARDWGLNQFPVAEGPDSEIHSQSISPGRTPRMWLSLLSEENHVLRQCCLDRQTI